jgi:hypothetical protein
MRRDPTAMLFWALRWHEGHRLSWHALSDVLWGEFACKPDDPVGSIRELMTYVKKRYGDRWTIDDNGRGYRISPRSYGVKVGSPTPTPIVKRRPLAGRGAAHKARREEPVATNGRCPLPSLSRLPLPRAC